jgi:hypothetical protein
VAQLFGRQSNWIARTVVIGLPILALLSIAVAEGVDRSSFITRAETNIDQPVPFSHVHHVGEVGIDCRYCHTQVEHGAQAQIPPTEVCMTCHSQIWSQSPTLESVRESYKSGQPIHWKRVYRLPDYVYFNHSIHIAKGIGCISCHGSVEKSNLTHLAQPLQMTFCLNCHKNPVPNLRPREEIANPNYVLESGLVTDELRAELSRKYHVESKIDCVTCHR